MNCETCKEKQKQADAVPYTVYEADMARMDAINKRTIKRGFAMWLVTFLVLMFCVIWFFWRESQFADEEITQEVWQEAESGSNQFVGGDFYGAPASEDDNPTQDS